MISPTPEQQELTAYVDVLAPLALVGVAALAAGLTVVCVYAYRYIEKSRELAQVREILGVMIATVDELRQARSRS
jgi:hypothetical protein